MIHAENLWKKFGRHEALRGLNMNVPEGSAYALIGVNGAGKTTTIKTILNFHEPTSGVVKALGVDSRQLSPRELAQIGYVSVTQDLPGGLTVRQYTDYLRPFYPTWDRDLEHELHKKLLLPPDSKIRDLSHGMRIKMALASALPYRPKLLVLDEPFSGLDTLVRDEFMDELLRQAGDMTIFVSTHELGEIETVATHIGFIDKGQMLFEEPIEDLTQRFREIRITFDHEAVVPAQTRGEWIQGKATGNVLVFVDTRFSRETIGEQVRGAFPGVTNIDVEPMSLRAIFTTLAREARKESL